MNFQKVLLPIILSFVVGIALAFVLVGDHFGRNVEVSVGAIIIATLMVWSIFYLVRSKYKILGYVSGSIVLLISIYVLYMQYEITQKVKSDFSIDQEKIQSAQIKYIDENNSKVDD